MSPAARTALRRAPGCLAPGARPAARPARAGTARTAERADPVVPGGRPPSTTSTTPPCARRAATASRPVVPLRPVPRPPSARHAGGDGGPPAPRTAAADAARPRARWSCAADSHRLPRPISQHSTPHGTRNTDMAIDPYAILRALLRAEAVRNAPKPQVPEGSRAAAAPEGTGPLTGRRRRSPGGYRLRRAVPKTERVISRPICVPRDRASDLNTPLPTTCSTTRGPPRSPRVPWAPWAPAISSGPLAPPAASRRQLLVRRLPVHSLCVTRVELRGTDRPVEDRRVDRAHQGLGGAQPGRGDRGRRALLAQDGDHGLARAEAGEQFLQVVRRVREGLHRGLEGLLVVRGEGAQRVLDAVAELGEDVGGDVLRRLRHEEDADPLRANQPHGLGDRVQEGLRRVVEEQMRLVEEEDELRLVDVADLRADRGRGRPAATSGRSRTAAAGPARRAVRAPRPCPGRPTPCAAARPCRTPVPRRSPPCPAPRRR